MQSSNSVFSGRHWIASEQRFRNQGAGDRTFGAMADSFRKFSRCIAVCALLLSSGCTGEESQRATHGVPEAVANADFTTQGSICPLESVNGFPVRHMPAAFAPGSVAEFVGWSTVADADNPTPPLVHLVFRAQIVGVSDTFIAASRMRRPDIANGNDKLMDAGYTAKGILPIERGSYRVLVWVGDNASQVECDTGIALQIR